MGWPFSYDATAKMAHDEIAKLKHQLQLFYQQPWFWKAVGATPYGRQIGRLGQDLLAAQKKGNAMIAYASDLQAFRYKLDRLSQLPPQGDPKVAGEAFGEVLLAAGKFVSYMPVPLNGYSTALVELGRNLGKIADRMSVEHRADASGMGRGNYHRLLNDPAGHWGG